MKFKLEDAKKFGWEGLKGWAYSSEEDFENASAAYFEVKDSHGKVKSTLSDRVYFVIEGKGEFNIDGEEMLVEKEDVIIVPKDAPYDYKAKSEVLKLFLVHVPAFSPEHEVELEE